MVMFLFSQSSEACFHSHAETGKTSTVMHMMQL